MTERKKNKTYNKYTPELADKIIECYEKNKGGIWLTSIDMNIPCKTLKVWREKHPEFGERMEAVKKKFVDNVSGRLYDLCMQGNVQALIFYLKCQGHWSEVQKVEVTNKNELNIADEIKKLKEALKDD